MERYVLSDIYNNITELKNGIKPKVSASGMLMEVSTTDPLYDAVLSFVCSCVYGYFYDDLIAYPSENDDPSEVEGVFEKRIAYDISVKFPYWFKKFDYVRKLLTTSDFSLLQTSKMTSSSEDLTRSAGGSLQKGATTPTGVSSGTAEDEIDVIIGSDGSHEITTDGFVDKYTNHQQKYANASRIEGERSGEILREGSIEELLKVLEKLPSSFADEITRELQKHFIFDYEGEQQHIY